MSFWPDIVAGLPIFLPPDIVEQLGLGDLAGEPLPLPAKFSLLVRLRALRSSPDVTVAGEPEDGVDFPEDWLLKWLITRLMSFYKTFQRDKFNSLLH